MKNTSQSKKNSGREYISYNTNRVIIFGTDGSKFKLRSVFDILTGKINMFVNKISILSLCINNAGSNYKLCIKIIILRIRSIHYTLISKNIEDFVNVPHLSFFVRNESIKMKPLDKHEMTAKYRKLLGVTHDEAVALAAFTKGYAYGYQVLGELCFRQDKSIIDSEIEDSFDEAIGSQYDLLWANLTEGEQKLIKIILDTESGSVADIKSKMKKNEIINRTF